VVVDRRRWGPDSQPLVDVYGRSITLRSMAGTIGELGNELDIQTSYSTTGSLTTWSHLGNTYIIQPLGDLRLHTVRTTGESVTYIAFITALSGDILDGNPDPAASNVLSGKLWLFASGDIGKPDARIQTEVGSIEGISTGGSVYILNLGGVEIGGVVDEVGDTTSNGIDAGGDVYFDATSPITVSEWVKAGGDIVITSTDTAGNDDITVLADQQLIARPARS
jgi:hypothetical protein